ncbi:MAG TPA: transcription repressor NadR [Thermotogota bacterium]|nr:transcription repressor NadR [Thermotogota bacterium]HPJ90199.1 transcription repressor NadR [Thermotogota bacterium]HPR97415.1 transcription repressor NadR [Thermotogota bacterium]
MDKNDRQAELIQILKGSKEAISGEELSNHFNVSRQVIVKDIASLRQDGTEILSTSRGYLLDRKHGFRKVIAVKHNREQIREELEIIIRNGGKVIDVMVEHPVYGEIRGDISISTEEELTKFVALINSSKAKPLLSVSDEGVHLHTIEIQSRIQYDQIEKELKEKHFWI